MRGSVYLGTFFGIKLLMHFSFVFILLYVAFVGWQEGFALERTLFEMALVLAIFFCVVLHEYGHALAARRYGIGTSQILLLPIGGVAQLKSLPDTAGRELFVAIAGPLVNLGIVLILLPIIGALYSFRVILDYEFIESNALVRLMFANAILLAFNMIPAFPMDGGRVLRALLSFRIKFSKATLIAVRVGQLMALGFAVLGFFVNYFLILIAFFVFIGAEAEYRMVKRKYGGRGFSVKNLIVSNPFTLNISDTLGRAAEAFLAGHGKDILVEDSGEIAGILPQSKLVTILDSEGQEVLVKDVMVEEFPWLRPEFSIAHALQLMRNYDLSVLPVRNEDDKLLGAVYAEQLLNSAPFSEGSHSQDEAA